MSITRFTKSMQGKSFRAERPLTFDEIYQHAPSIMAQEAHHSRSERYGFVPTYEIIRGLQREGFEPFYVAQSGSRSDDKYGHANHMVRLRHTNDITLKSAKEIIIANDSAGGGSYKTALGYLNGACMNGCIFGDGIEMVSVRHGRNAVNNVIEGVFTVLSNSDKVDESVDQMKSIILSRHEQLEFADCALKLRYEEGKTPITSRQVMIPWREEEEEPTLWNTFQMAQEKIIRGGVRGASTGKDGKRRRVTTRPINSIGDNLQLNRQLWSLADAFAAIKQGRVLTAA